VQNTAVSVKEKPVVSKVRTAAITILYYASFPCEEENAVTRSAPTRISEELIDSEPSQDMNRTITHVLQVQMKQKDSPGTGRIALHLLPVWAVLPVNLTRPQVSPGSRREGSETSLKMDSTLGLEKEEPVPATSINRTTLF
jgi:hypothetical protein